MLLSARMLLGTTVNGMVTVEQISWTQGDTLDVYFQLVDLNYNPPAYGSYPEGSRYVPAAGATLTVTMESIDTAQTILNRVCTQPFVGDSSIWKFSVLSTDTISGTLQLRLTLNQGGVITRGKRDASCLVWSDSNI